MLDALRTGGNRPLDALRRIGMDRGIGAAIGRRLDAGAQFRLGEGRHVERGARRGHAAAGHQLDLRGALHELLARAQANLVRAIRDGGAAGRFREAEPATAGAARQIGEWAQIAMAAGRGNHRAAGIDARPGDQSLVDGLLEGEGRPAEIAHRGEAAQ